MGTITSNGLYTASSRGGVAFIYAQPVGSKSSFVSIVHQLRAPATSSGSFASTVPAEVSNGVTLRTGHLRSNTTSLLTDPIAGVIPFEPTNPVGTGPDSGISVLVAPAIVALQSGQSAAFTAAVQGSQNQQVQWSLNPAAGSVVNGFYTAPDSIDSVSQVTITATSLADPTVTATAIVVLTPSVSIPPLSSVSISIAPGPAALTAGQSAQFTASVQGTINLGALWSLTPNVGTIVNGFYTAPASIPSQQFVLVTATSVADPTQSATVAVTLQPASSQQTVSVSLSPGSVALIGGESSTFVPTVTGTSNTAVTWSVSPQEGAIANGVYQAPAIIASQQNLTVFATSVADSTKSAGATVTLVPVGVAVAPTSVSLGAGGSAAFTATVSGTGNPAVSWSLSPAIGTLSNGVYTAPATITSAQTVTLTVASLADSTKTATATINLTGPVGLSLTPSSVPLMGGQSATFTPTVSGTSNTAVQWSISPQVGSIANGVYQAPAIVASHQTVTVTATSMADSMKTASATVSLIPIKVTVAPNAMSLGVGASATFVGTVTGTSNTAATWSLNPAVGTLSNGIYTAPAMIATAQTVTLTVASEADPSETATATIHLIPVGVSLSPGATSLTGGQSATFTPTVTGTTLTAVTWSLTPALGTIANGVYQAPVIVASQQIVTVMATSVADSTKIASATVTLIPIAVTVSPNSVSVGAGGSAAFAASVSGTGNPAVTWSLNPSVGTIVNGVYTAPAAISSAQTVTLTVASVVDSTKTATAAISLIPGSLSLAPGSVSLTGGQSTTFTATLTGKSNPAVAWSLSPQVGTIANGVYQAPAIIASTQTVTVIATSTTDSAQTASATVNLIPIGVTVSPTSASVGAGQSATFTASVNGTSNTAVSWSLSPAVGTLVNGLYTAPAAVSAPQTITVTAASTVDPTKTATATLTLTPGSSGNPPTTVTLPLEVIGSNGTTVSATVNIPSGSNLAGQMSLWMQIHGLRSQTQASVQVNNSGWQPINSGTVTLLGNANAYGGIGGGFSTLTMTMNFPAGTFQTGNNTVGFLFNQTDGRVSGFRVLAFNIQAANGSQLIPASTFVQDNPNTWQPPSSSASDIAAGQTLWHTAALTTPLVTGGTQPIVAHCSDCHAQDGRDLKYFNYSNNSIQTRALFHGLTAQQGDQIASYIRSLNVVNPGMPWNPPYQPGPGLDSQPVINWAAGAGLSAVADSDQDVINAIFPSGIQASVFAATSRLSQREIPLALQLPDWNQWLPGVSPMDAFGSTFTGNGYDTIYQTLSSSLQVNNPAVYVAQQANLQAWFSAFNGLYQQLGTPIWNNLPAAWTPANVDAMYSLSQWGLVKTWELNNQFQLEGYAQNIFGPQADPRAWYSDLPFFVSPHELKMPTTGVTGLRNGTAATYVYLSYVWYNLQLILNDSNGQQQEQYPIDWPYSDGFVMNLGELVAPQGGIQTIWMIKGLQIMQQSGAGPQLGLAGWQPTVSQISLLVTPEWNQHVWSGVDPATRIAIATGLIQTWLQQASQFTPQQFYAGGWTTATAVPVPGGNAYDNVFPDWVWYMIPRFSFIGVNSTLVTQLAQWAQTIWPDANWTADLNATCSWQNNVANDVILCSQ